VDRAGTALCNAATKFGSGQVEVLTQHPEQGFVGRRVGGHGLAVECERNHVVSWKLTNITAIGRMLRETGPLEKAAYPYTTEIQGWF
jgi:hypothetical protein